MRCHDRLIDRLPHRYPLVLVDRIVALTPGEQVTAVKAVSRNEVWYRNADATDLAYPSVLLFESWCQTAGVLLAAGGPGLPELSDRLMLIGSATHIRFRGAAYPGDVLTHRVRLRGVYGETVCCEGESLVAQRPALEVEQVLLALRPASVLIGIDRPEPRHVTGVHH